MDALPKRGGRRALVAATLEGRRLKPPIGDALRRPRVILLTSWAIGGLRVRGAEVQERRQILVEDLAPLPVFFSLLAEPANLVENIASKSPLRGPPPSAFSAGPKISNVESSSSTFASMGGRATWPSSAFFAAAAPRPP